MKKLVVLVVLMLAQGQTLGPQDQKIYDANARLARAYTSNIDAFNIHSNEFAETINKWVILKRSTVAVQGRDKNEEAQWKVVKEKWGLVDQAGKDWAEVEAKMNKLIEAVDGE